MFYLAFITLTFTKLNFKKVILDFILIRKLRHKYQDKLPYISKYCNIFVVKTRYMGMRYLLNAYLFRPCTTVCLWWCDKRYPNSTGWNFLPGNPSKNEMATKPTSIHQRLQPAHSISRIFVQNVPCEFYTYL